MTDKIYVPDYQSGNCAYIVNSDVIRVYDKRPTNGSVVGYKDYYPKLNYEYNIGSTEFYQYSTIPTCREVTTNIFDRPGIDSYVLMILILLILCLSFIFTSISKIFRGR